jgi:hypothetical protein
MAGFLRAGVGKSAASPRSCGEPCIEETYMPLTKRLLALLLTASLFVFGVAACGDDPGEDKIGDGEINDPGD